MGLCVGIHEFAPLPDTARSHWLHGDRCLAGGAKTAQKLTGGDGFSRVGIGAGNEEAAHRRGRNSIIWRPSGKAREGEASGFQAWPNTAS